MTSYRPFQMNDLFKFNNVNLDRLTETYNMSFYCHYLATWPEYFVTAESPNGDIQGYVMGKAEGDGPLWHGHVTAVTVSPKFRRLGIGRDLMSYLEYVSRDMHNCYFVDLFVRASNSLAISMYEKFGYIKYRRVVDYYTSDGIEDGEDAWDMRKALPRDIEKKSVIPLKYPIRPEDLEW